MPRYINVTQAGDGGRELVQRGPVTAPTGTATATTVSTNVQSVRKINYYPVFPRDGVLESERVAVDIDRVAITN